MTAAPRIELDSPAPEAVDGRQIRAVTFQRIRLRYVRNTLDRLGLPAAGRSTLVVGSGRGLLARGLAGLGLDVTAVDPSAAATAMARETSEHEHLGIPHTSAPAEELGLPDASFDLAYYADTFEVTARLDRVLAEAARVLKPGGVLLYDTVNRTMVSRLIYLGAFQTLPMTRIMPPGRYAADRLRPPAELARALDRHGLHNEEICGFKPTGPGPLIKATLALRHGRITDEEAASVVDFVLAPGHRPVVTYFGQARK